MTPSGRRQLADVERQLAALRTDLTALRDDVDDEDDRDDEAPMGDRIDARLADLETQVAVLRFGSR